MNISLSDCFLHLSCQQIVIYKRFCCLAGKLHHHPSRSIRIHIRIFSSHIIRLRLYDFQKNITSFGFTGYTALISISNIYLCHILTPALHQFHLHTILDFLHTHLLLAPTRNTVGNIPRQFHIFSFVRMQHGPSHRSNYFFFIKPHYPAISFQYSLYHILCILLY